MRLVERIHGRSIQGRRISVLARHLATLVPPHASLLDVGCGDGRLARALMAERPGCTAVGIDVLVRRDTAIPVIPFDGESIPHGAGAFDCVLLADVLHHAGDPDRLLAEAARVARQSVLIKDHLLEGLLAGQTLKLMDRIGNARFGVASPGDYMTLTRWQDMFARRGLVVEAWLDRLKLYPWYLDLWFGRSLHFVAKLLVPGDGHPHTGASPRPANEE